MTKQTSIPIGSVTNAMRGQHLLEQYGFSVQIQRLLHTEGQNGCGYQLLINGDKTRAMELLRSAGLRVGNGGNSQ